MLNGKWAKSTPRGYFPKGIGQLHGVQNDSHLVRLAGAAAMLLLEKLQDLTPYCVWKKESLESHETPLFYLILKQFHYFFLP